MALTQLDILYDFEPKKLNYIDRKATITEKRVVIRSPRKSGVTYLIYSHLQNYKKEEYLYIDFDDLRVDKLLLEEALANYIKEKQISLLVLDNFDFSFKIPNTQETIITTDKNISVDGFSYKNFFPLDFEEYIGFNKWSSNIEHIFNSYANTGTYPAVVLSDTVDRLPVIQRLLKETVKDGKKLEILKEFSLYQAQKVSFYQIFNLLKERLKISKDSFYETVKEFSEDQMLIFVEKYGSKKASKKLFLIDFTIKNALTYKKDFLKRFENILFLELYKRGKEIYYTDDIDLYLPKEKSAVLSIPFLPANLLKNKILKRKKEFKKLGIKRVSIISLGNEDLFEDNGITYEITPFWNWVAGL